MGNRYRIEVKKHEANSQNFVSKIRKPCYSKIRSSPIDRVLFLQRTIGNQAVQKLIKSRALQAKLRIGAPGDKYEQKADRVAEEVMRMPQPRAIDRHGSKPSIQRLCTSCEEKGFQKQHVEEDLEKLRMQPIDEDEEKLRKQSIEEDEEKNPQIEEIRGNCAETTSDVGSSIVAIRGGGQSLSETVRAYFEPRFSHDFSHVRVHAGMQADELARGVNARAFTIGSDIVFRAGQYAPPNL